MFGEPSGARRRRILIVDDSPEVLKIVKEYLEAEGYAVHAANSTDAGLRLLDAGKERFDLAIIDGLMPRMIAGLQIRGLTSPGAVPVVLASDRPETLEAFNHDGCTVLRKPFRLAQLRAVLDERLAGDR